MMKGEAGGGGGRKENMASLSGQEASPPEKRDQVLCHKAEDRRDQACLPPTAKTKPAFLPHRCSEHMHSPALERSLSFLPSKASLPHASIRMATCSFLTDLASINCLPLKSIQAHRGRSYQTQLVALPATNTLTPQETAVFSSLNDDNKSPQISQEHSKGGRAPNTTSGRCTAAAIMTTCQGVIWACPGPCCSE